MLWIHNRHLYLALQSYGVNSQQTAVLCPSEWVMGWIYNRHLYNALLSELWGEFTTDSCALSFCVSYGVNSQQATVYCPSEWVTGWIHNRQLCFALLSELWGEFTTDTCTLLALLSELWGVAYKYFGENWACYSSAAVHHGTKTAL